METEIQELIIVKVFHNGKEKARFEGKDAPTKAFGYVQKAQPMSVFWAIKYENWLIQEFNEKGNFYWTENHYGI
jgi:hypothetical protein